MTNNPGKIELSSSKKMKPIFDMSTRQAEGQPYSNQKLTPKKRFEYASNATRFSGPVDQQLFLRKTDSRIASENDQVGFSDQRSSDSQGNVLSSGFSTGESGAGGVDKSLIMINHNANFSMSRRRKSQGLDRTLQRSAQKFQTKPGKVIADYLPQIPGAEKNETSIFQPHSLNSSIMGAESEECEAPQEKPLRRLIGDKKAQALTCPLSLGNRVGPVTPKKKIHQSGEQFVEDSDSAPEEAEELKEDSDDSDDNDDEDSDNNEAEKEVAKMEEFKQFAEENGFELKFERELKPVEEEKFVMTPEFLARLQKEDDKRFLEQMKKYIPPPLEILKKQYTTEEPVRTGFNQGLLPVKIKNNFVRGRTAQGPQIVVTSSSQFSCRAKEAAAASERNNSKNSRRQRPESKEGSLQRQNSSRREGRAGAEGGTRDGPDADAFESNDPDQLPVQQVVKEAFMNSETSLRHLFYLEYKRNFVDGATNPIVYSRFGKQCYDSDERFDNNNFNQLIRTCNLKKILRLQNHIAAKGERKFSEPISFPSCDYYKPKDQNDRTLVFESRFESGNLQLVSKVSDAEYNLVLQNDINSKGHTQWFYFRVTNVRKGMKVKFNMLNMIKPKSLYNEGMKVLSYSEKRQEAAESEEEKGWTRGGEELSYYQNNYRREHQTNFQRCYYTFTFTHAFEFDDDSVYFSYSLPYTYSDLTEDLCEIQSRQLNYVSRNTLCRTIAGNKCEYLTITNRVPFEVDQKKEGVVISARIHPGESNASWMMKGVIDFLVSDDPQASKLRDKFVFKIIPMLNPDGVINGNYRCSLAGCDLNRRWKYPSEILHPTVWHTKKLIMKLAQERPLALYCDIHGHSRRKNAFFYGNGSQSEPNAARVFPFLMSKIAQPHYSYDYSRFSINRSKEQTARIAIWRDLGSKHSNIYTLEASFCGPKPVKFEPHRGKQKAPTAQELNYHFNTQDFLEVGQNLCKTLLLYRNESETEMGLQNVEYQVEQYHIEKEAKLEQEDLIRQQKAITEQRKLQQLNNRTRFGSNAFGDFDTNVRASQQVKDSSAQKPQLTSEKKKVTKTKTAALTEDITQTTKPVEKEKKEGQAAKCKYRVQDSDEESNLESDSGPSDDNLDNDEIMRLIPKKFQKCKYIRGVQEKKKKPVVESEKKVVKKPKATLMPCMIKAKQDRDASKTTARNASESTAKKVSASVQKSVVSTLKKGGKQRDVGTQIKYTGDGTQLSLMELDILKYTGCKWSKIIYPGFKGTRFQESFMSAEKFQLDSAYRTSNYNRVHQLTSPNKGHNQFMANFNKEFNQILDGNGLRNSRKASETINPPNLNDVSTFLLRHSQSATKNKNDNPPFQNELILKAAREAQNQNPQSAMSTLQKQIMDKNFSEPRSLIGGSNKKQTQQFEDARCSSSSKKRQLMGLPSNEVKIELSHKFELGDLETVHEKVQEKSLNTIEVGNSGKGKIKRNSSINQNSVTKKVVNGMITTQSGPLRIKNDSALKLRNPNPATVNNSAQKQGGVLSSTTSATKHKPSESRSSFATAAQQILNASIEGPFQQDLLRMKQERELTLDYGTKPAASDYSSLANIAPSQMAQQVLKIQQRQEQRNSQLSQQKGAKICLRDPRNI